jgi:transcriptional regulator with PAS, ATPase and Fis domain
LRVIEEREFYRLGSTEIRHVDVRIIAASNRDINEEIIKNRFRADLFYRINMYNIKIPPLRERKDDILPLAKHFLKIHARANSKKIQRLALDLSERMLQSAFLGNVRELENIIAGAVLLERGNTLSLASAHNLLPYNGPERRKNVELLTLGEIERRHIKRVLDITNGNRPKAAKILGINVSTIYRKLEKYNLTENY